MLAPTGAPLAGPSDYGGPYPETTADPQPSTTSDPVPTAPASPAPPSTGPTTTSPTGGATTTTTTSTTTTTTTTVATTLPPLPLSVSPSVVTVGRGGVATISGTCPETGGVPLGPVTLWEVGDTIGEVATGITAATWTYEWRAPGTADVDVLQVWCGDPATWQGGYPVDLQIRVVYVAQATRSPRSPGDGSVSGEDPLVVLPASV